MPETTQTPPRKGRYHFYIPLYALPALLVILFYILRSHQDVMDRVGANVSAPVRGFLGLLTSVFPFSVMEAALTIAGIWAVCFIVKTIIMTVRGERKLRILGDRLLSVALVLISVWSLWCWLWNSGYYKSGLSDGVSGVTSAELAEAAKIFAQKANEFAPVVKRDANGRFIESLEDIFAASGSVYDNIVSEFPSLSGRSFRPKPMIYSWLMSRTGYTGIYFALTGEANINVNAPPFLIPATIAHELAHQRGVCAEDEANFAAIAACVTSGNTVYEYSGYLMGLIHLTNAMRYTDPAWSDIRESLCDEILTDFTVNSEYWQAQRTSNTGIEIIDEAVTAMTEIVSGAVNTVYDDYLKSQGQQLGIHSYGACVDMLVRWTIDSK